MSARGSARESGAAGLLLIIAAMLWFGCTPRDPSRLGSLAFDDRKIEFYWYGERIQSPAVFTWTPSGLSVNGVAVPEPESRDTTGDTMRLAGFYRGLPYVDSLVATGMGWHDAATAMTCEYPRRMRLAVLDERARADAQSRAEDVGVMRRNIARATALPLDSVVAYQGWLYCNAPGRLRFAVNLRWREADLRRDPCTEPPAPARADGVATVKHLRQWLVSHYASLIVMDSTLKTVSGPKGRRGKREIEEALVIAKRDGVAALRSRLVGYEGVLSRRELGNIAQHATKP